MINGIARSGNLDMLSDVKIKKIITSSEIKVTVAFGWEKDKLVEYPKEKPLFSSPSSKNLYSDRLKLTMGPIIKILDKNPVSKRYRYKNFKDCHDLRKSDNKYIIKPGESIILLTNEQIKLNGKYACLVVPRISLSDVGIVVSTAYVDPYYFGLMRLHLTNMSERPYELSVLEAIAQCFFFEMSDDVSKKYQDEFSTKSVFYGQTWTGILKSDRKPFPTKKESVFEEKFERIKHAWNTIKAFVKKNSILSLIIVNSACIIGGGISFYNMLNTYKQQVEEISNWLDPISSEIIIDKGKLEGEKKVVVECSKADIISVLTNNEDIHYELSSGVLADKTEILFTYKLPMPASSQYEMNFTYVIVKRKR